MIRLLTALVLSLSLPVFGDSEEVPICQRIKIDEDTFFPIRQPKPSSFNSIFLEKGKNGPHFICYSLGKMTSDEDSLELLFHLERNDSIGEHLVSCQKIKIKKGALEEVYKWFHTLEERKEELYKAFQHEGIFLESVFLEKAEEGDYLIYYKRKDQLDRAHTLVCSPIRIFHFECQERCCDRSSGLKLLFDQG